MFPEVSFDNKGDKDESPNTPFLHKQDGPSVNFKQRETWKLGPDLSSTLPSQSWGEASSMNVTGTPREGWGWGAYPAHHTTAPQTLGLLGMKPRTSSV